MEGGLRGFRAWLWQRATALYLAVYLVYLLAKGVLDPPADLEALRAWLGATPVWIATALFGLSLLLHAWIGVRDVVLDYVKPAGLRLVILALVLLFLLANGVWLAALLLELR